MPHEMPELIVSQENEDELPAGFGACNRVPQSGREGATMPSFRGLGYIRQSGVAMCSVRVDRVNVALSHVFLTTGNRRIGYITSTHKRSPFSYRLTGQSEVIGGFKTRKAAVSAMLKKV